MATIYALLVGIEGYTRKPLDGCINDVYSVHEALKQLYGSDHTLQVRLLTDLTDEKPTRANIVRAFEFFNAATAADTCLFYYSGHGSFSVAPPEFRSDNGFMQSFVCLDSRLPGGRDLMDKEMSYLIWQATKDKPGMAFVSVIDCCHSGTITKEARSNDLVKERLLQPDASHLPPRLSEYLGFGSGAYLVSNTPGGKVITVVQGPHIHFSASRDTQTAKELGIGGLVRGAFTYAFIKTLYACKGQISYRDLAARTAASVAGMVSDQQPGILVNGGLPGTEKDKNFLVGAASLQEAGYLVYNDRETGWRINAGLSHDVAKDDIVIIPGIAECRVAGTPAPDYAFIKVPENLSAGTAYRGTVERNTERLAILGIVPTLPAEAAALLETAMSAQRNNEFTLGELKNASYWIDANNAGPYLAYPGTARPLFKPVDINDPGDAHHFLEEVLKVIRWKRLLELHNPSSSLVTDDYRIDVSYAPDTGGPFTPADWTAEPVDLYYQRINGQWQPPVIRLAFTNTSGGPLWVTNAYLGFDFGVTTDFFEELEVGHATTVAIGFPGDMEPGKPFNMTIDDHYSEKGYQYIREYIKLFIAKGAKVNTDGLAQEGAELPPVNQAMGPARIKGSQQADSGWQTETIGFNIIRPQDGRQLSSHSPAFLGALSIAAPAGFSATASLNSSLVTERGADGAAAPNRTFNNTTLAPWNLAKGYLPDNIMDVLELSGLEGVDTLSADNPLMLRLASVPAETVIPLGIDAATGLCYPLGFMDSNGVISLSVLPEETPTDQELTNRSFSGSVKIYFQKVIGSKLGFAYTYPRLALASVGDDGDVSYDADPATLSAAISGAQNILLFIHGIIGDTEGMVKCSSRYTGIILTFDYENLNTTIEDNAVLLKDALEKAGLKPGHGKNLTIAAHSMGGLVSRYFIEHLDGAKLVSRLVMLGTPNNGTPWADVRDLAAALLTFAINGAAMLKPAIAVLSIAGRWSQGLQVTLKQMNTATGIYHGLNIGTDPGIPYIVIAGNTGLLIARYHETAGLIVRTLSKIRQRGLYDALDTVLFNEPNDIAVTDESINELPGASAWTIKPVYHQVACDHLNYFTSETSLSHLFASVH